MDKKTFLSKLYQLFPESASSGQVKRKNVLDTCQELGLEDPPFWILNPDNRVSHGVYRIPPVEDLTTDISDFVEPVTSVNLTLVNRQPNPEESMAESLIPKVDTNYVPFGNFKDIELIVKSKQFYPVYITGPSGNGKSSTVEQVCAKHKRPMIRINLNMLSDEDQLIGSKTLVDGSIKIVEGPVIMAMKMGIPLLLDEIDAGSSNALLCLQSILEGKPYFFKLTNEVVTPAKGFNIFATANTKGKGSEDGRYIGTNILNEAFLERFAITMEQEYPKEAVEIRILSNLMKSMDCFDQNFAESLVKWAAAVRKTFDDGGIDETISTRRLTHIVRTYSIFNNKKKSVQLAVNRFDNLTRDAFMNLFEKISTEELVNETSIPVLEESFD